MDVGPRKNDHLTLCATGDVGFHRTTTLLEDVRLVHDALPDLDAASIDTSCTLLGKRLRAPIVVASMTGGTDEGRRINRELAALAEERGYGFGLGSQRAMVEDPSVGETYRVRDVAPTTLVLGNIGVVQARAMSTSAVRALVTSVGADALCVHLNPAMEIIQPGGDRDFSGGLETIARLVRELDRPVVVKETGCGISLSVARRLLGAGVAHVDVSGAGGTSWVGVETTRADAARNAPARALGEAFWEWGIPTAACVAALAPLGLEIIATGGIKTGLDVAKSIALGARACAVARPALVALQSGGRAAAAAFFDAMEAELRAAMLLTRSRTMAELALAPRVVGRDLELWLASLS